MLCKICPLERAKIMVACLIRCADCPPANRRTSASLAGMPPTAQSRPAGLGLSSSPPSPSFAQPRPFHSRRPPLQAYARPLQPPLVPPPYPVFPLLATRRLSSIAPFSDPVAFVICCLSSSFPVSSCKISARNASTSIETGGGRFLV